MTGAGTKPRLEDDCFAPPDGAISVADALDRLRRAARPVTGIERVPLRDAVGRILAEPLVSPRDVPAFANAAVDGWAVRHADLAREGPTRLAVLEGRAAAGHPFAGRLAEGTALRVLTGAPLPEGADSVVMQEEVAVADGILSIPTGLERGANRREAGEDMKSGREILPRGFRLRSQDVAAAAATGAPELAVFRPLAVAILSAGDELREPGAPLAEGGVFDCNRYMLHAQLRSLPCRVTDLGIVPDDPDAVRDALARAARTHDVVLTSGGASKGDEDHVVRAVEALGRLDFWQIALKPGRPLAFGRLGDAVFIGLPGNPVAVFTGFFRFAGPLLAALAGGPFAEPARFPLPAAFTLRTKPGRTELLRARLVRPASGGLAVARVPRAGSGIVTALVEADGLIELGPEAATIREGDPVDFLPFGSFGPPLA